MFGQARFFRIGETTSTREEKSEFKPAVLHLKIDFEPYHTQRSCVNKYKIE